MDKQEMRNRYIFVEITELLQKDEESGAYTEHKDSISNLLRILWGNNRKINEPCKIVIIDNIGQAELISNRFEPRYIDFIFCDEEIEIDNLINVYISKHEKTDNFIVVDSGTTIDLEVKYPFHCVHTNNKKIDDLVYNQINRKLNYGNGWEREYMYGYNSEIDDGFKNVVFLDIDGVLNKDKSGEEANYPIIEPAYVENLAHIVKETNSEIIISSSWRYSLARLDCNNLSKHEKELFHQLSKNRICIAGTTPLIGNGPDGRPLEIRNWLARRPSVKNFVILDDETFWRWNWLQPHVVTTEYYQEGEQRKWEYRHAGLEEIYIPEAIRILSQF